MGDFSDGRGMIALMAIMAIFGNGNSLPIKITDEERKEFIDCLEKSIEETKKDIENIKNNSFALADTEQTKAILESEQNTITYFTNFIEKLKSGEEIPDIAFYYGLKGLCEMRKKKDNPKE